LQESLNPFIRLGKNTTKKVREKVQALLNEDNPNLKDHQSRGKIMLGLKEAEMLIPINIGDITSTFNDESEETSPLSGSFPHGYYGKASSIIPSGIPLTRPRTNLKNEENNGWKLGPVKKLDFEIKLACVIGKSSKLGESIPIAEAEDYIFGYTLLNDWVIRDNEGGPHPLNSPFSSKNFACAISPWIVTLDALEAFRTTSPLQNHDLLYLQSKESQGLDIHLEAILRPEKGAEIPIYHTNFKYAKWNMVQLLAHQTLNGSNIEIGDLIASGAPSSPEGNPLKFSSDLTDESSPTPEGEMNRGYIKNGETVTVKAFGKKDGIRIGFGEVNTKVLPFK
jgi:fumarylacetoacetase